jgi:hypothetical protein
MQRIITLVFVCVIALVLAKAALDTALALPVLRAQAEAWRAAW